MKGIKQICLVWVWICLYSAQGSCIFYILEMCIDRKKEIELNVFDQFYVFRGTERKHERCRFQKIEAWDGSLQRLWQRSVSIRKAPKSQVSSSFCPTETSSQGGNWDLETLRTSCPTFDFFRSSTLLCCYIFSSTNIYCNVLWMIIWLGNQQLSAWLYNHEKNRNKTTNHSPQHV